MRDEEVGTSGGGQGRADARRTQAVRIGLDDAGAGGAAQLGAERLVIGADPRQAAVERLATICEKLGWQREADAWLGTLP